MISADQVFLLYEVSNVAFRSFSAWCTDQFIFLQSHILQLLKFDVLINSFFLQSHILHLVQFDVLINSNSCDFFTFCSLLCWCTDQFKFPWLFHLLQLFLNFLYFLFSLFNKKNLLQLVRLKTCLCQIGHWHSQALLISEQEKYIEN